ncbi:hypothetical protein GINT2_000755 [Glugoides intestinalis]
MLLLHLLLVCCYHRLIETIKGKVARLHQLTKSSTYYDFFNISENASSSEIKKAFRKLRRSTPPAGMSKEDFNELVMNGYSVLNNWKSAYDNFLLDSKFIYINKAENYKNSFFVVIISIVSLLVFIDFVMYSFKYLKYLNNSYNYKKAKKDEKKANIKEIKEALRSPPPSMYTKRIVNSASSIFNKRR